MKVRLFAMFLLGAGLALVLTWAVVAQKAQLPDLSQSRPYRPFALDWRYSGATDESDALGSISPSPTISYTAHYTTFADLTARYPLPLLTPLRAEGLIRPAVSTLARDLIGDFWADVVVGQPDFTEVAPNQVVANRTFNALGVFVDRSVRPNRVYVYDSGNNRVLGLSHLGTCEAGQNAGQACTVNSDCPGSSCALQEDISADLVLGQPSLTDHSACNGDSGFQTYPTRAPASEYTMCTLHPGQISIREGGSAATMAVDSQGNLYVPDFFNNRVLRFNSPYDTDAIADDIYGQSDFIGTECNRGMSEPGASSLCLAPPLGFGMIHAGVAIDSDGNLWVADNMNHRVLRFPESSTGFPEHEADLVLGQPNFTSGDPPTNWPMDCSDALDRMCSPASVRVDSAGRVYVADFLNNRVLFFDPPYTSGMAASGTLGSNLREPTGLEFDPGGGIWVNDSGNRQLLLFEDGIVSKVLFKDVPDYTGTCSSCPVGDIECHAWGGIGVDVDGNVMTTGWDHQELFHFPSPIPDPAPGAAPSTDAIIFPTQGWWAPPNFVGPYGLNTPVGVEIAAGQLIVVDEGRILFWNNPWNLTSGKPADGYVGTESFSYSLPYPRWARIRADQNDRLWIIHEDKVFAYSLPLSIGASPVMTISSPLQVLGGGTLSWPGPPDFSLWVGGLAPEDSGDRIWVSDPYRHRVFRISHAMTDPVADIVLGQTSLEGAECNQGRGRDYPTRDSLCYPGALALDPQGNLWISDHSLEFIGNHRLLRYNGTLFPDSPATALFGIPASQVYGRDGSFTEPDCLDPFIDPLCAPFETAFDSAGLMVVGLNAYLGSRFPLVYQDPLTNPLPITNVQDLYGMAYSAVFDQFNNLYVTGLNRNRVLIYKFQDVKTFTVSGRVRDKSGASVPDVLIQTTHYAARATTDAAGMYALTGLITGTYELVPSKDFYTFSPITRTVSVPAITGGQDFVAYESEEHNIYLPVILRND
jgi:DNA-binding beta-propeller fold protein YncE